ncbi:MAG TPA: bifunctional lysylphosphatidylglycerol flippase/synthetase MprF [Nevskiaceae bacterium]|nr:bifunctional lysylphosphatidylglycerol flippase/synthetase MprF [Nevskiaceae bacterium]
MESAAPIVPAETTWSRLRSWLPTLIALALIAMVLLAIRSLLREVSYDEVADAVLTTRRSAIAWSVLATVASYISLLGYDWSGARYAGIRLPRGTLALASFVGYALGNSVGLGALTGGAVRFRIYSAAGIEAGRIGKLVMFIVSAFGAGVTVVAAASLMWAATHVGHVAHLSPLLLRVIAGSVLALAAGFIVLCFARREVLLLGRWQLQLPTGGVALAQLAVSVADIIAAAAALWFLLPGARESFPQFVAFYSIALAAGVISHVPGGLGVFEGVLLLAYGHRAPLDALAGALLLYRAIYFIGPLFLAMLVLAFYELRASVAGVGRAAAQLSPMLLSVWTLIVGIMLLVSGVTPATGNATELLSLHVPLQIVEASHFIGSIAGLGLLFVARGLLYRLDAAWWAALVLTIVAFWLALPKGIALTEMAVLAFLAFNLIVGRREFDRRASLFSQVFSRGWMLMVGAVLVGVGWVMFFVYQDIDYTHELWWQFAFDAHAPRSLRLLLAAVVSTLGVAMWQWFRPYSGNAGGCSPADLEHARGVLREQPRADACLALTGDKSLLFSRSGKAFLMYGKRGRTWVSLYDPVGAQQDLPELVWSFMELAAAHGGRAVFYQVRPQNLSLYVDTGLRPFKLGEDARVALASFTTKGSANAHLRQAINKGEREGLSLEIVPAEGVAAQLPELARISDAWLETHNTREKHFSLGAFDPNYLAALPVAVVRRAGAPIAFANILCTALKDEARVDLMRYAPGAPNGTMDYLFVKLMLHFQAEGYAHFGLGMAPFSGLVRHPLAPRWHRLGSLLFGLGEHFYNFQGLRSFKEKFHPQWEPRYLCSPGGSAPLFALADIASLTSGGLKGVISK